MCVLVSARYCSREAILSHRLASRWRHVDGVAVATSTGCKVQCDVLLQACVASTSVAVACRCIVRRWICCYSVRYSTLWSQLSHGGATSSKDGSRVIINDRRVWARMLAIELRIAVCSCLNRLIGDAGCSQSTASGRLRLWQGSVRTQTSATHAKTHRVVRPPPRWPLTTTSQRQV